jgi:hypothetical protein
MGKIDQANRHFRRMHAEARSGNAGGMGIYCLRLTAREDMFELILRAAAGYWLAFACCRATHPTVDVLQTAITEFFCANFMPTLRVLLPEQARPDGYA